MIRRHEPNEGWGDAHERRGPPGARPAVTVEPHRRLPGHTRVVPGSAFGSGLARRRADPAVGGGPGGPAAPDVAGPGATGAGDADPGHRPVGGHRRAEAPHLTYAGLTINLNKRHRGNMLRRAIAVTAALTFATACTPS